jgi:hypothetical protein
MSVPLIQMLDGGSQNHKAEVGPGHQSARLVRASCRQGGSNTQNKRGGKETSVKGDSAHNF